MMITKCDRKRWSHWPSVPPDNISGIFARIFYDLFMSLFFFLKKKGGHNIYSDGLNDFVAKKLTQVQ